jgi:Leucine-rich repeat (LRR) protein
VSTLQTLEWVDVRAGVETGSQVTTDGILALTTLKKLRHLAPPENLSGDGLKVITSLEQLEDLRLGNCPRMGTADLDCLKALPNLKRLDIAYCELTNDALKHLGTLNRLEELNLPSNPDVTDAGLAEMRKCDNLRTVDVVGTKVTARSVAVFKSLPKLEQLSIGGFGDTYGPGVGEIDLSTCRELRRIDISRLDSNEIVGTRLPKSLREAVFPLSMVEGVDQMRRVPHLECLKVVMPIEPHNVELVSWTMVPELTELCIENPDGFVIGKIASLKQLRALSFTGDCRRIDDSGLRQVSQMRQLERVEIMDCLDVTDSGLRCLRGMERLRELKLLQLKQVTVAGLALLGEAKQLRKMSLGFRPNSSIGCVDSALSRLGALEDLEELSILGATLSDGGLKSLAGLKKLRRLDLMGSYGYTDEGLSALMQSLPRLDVVKRSYRKQSQ